MFYWEVAGPDHTVCGGLGEGSKKDDGDANFHYGFCFGAVVS